MNIPEQSGPRLHGSRERRDDRNVIVVPMGRKMYLVDGSYFPGLPDNAIRSETLSERLREQTLKEVHALAISSLGAQAIGTSAEISLAVQQELE